jgi:cysteine synthase A
MSESFSIERRKLIKAYGAKVILTPSSLRGSGKYLTKENKEYN